MPKFYLSKSNSSTDQSTAQSSSTDYAILLSDTSNHKLVRFFKNGNHIDNLNYGGYSQPTKSLFSGLGSEFTKFFSGNNANSSVNAFAYMRSNANNITNNAGLSWN